jgi:hypothetical protein
MKISGSIVPGLILVALCMSGCAPQESVSSRLAKEAKAAAKSAREQGVQGAVMNGSKLSGGDAEGRPLWELSAQQIKTSGTVGTSGTPQRATLTGARASLYKVGKLDTTFTAQTIYFFHTPQGLRLKLVGNVNVKSLSVWTNQRGPVSLQAPRADVNIDTQTVSASGPVVMTQGNVQVVGNQVRAENSLKTMTIKGGVTAKSPQGTFKAQSGIWGWESNKMTALLPVAEHEGVVVAGTAMSGDTAADSGDITGSVTARGPRGNATAQRVHFNWKQNQIEAIMATFTQGESSLKAASLTTDSKLNLASARDVTANKDGATVHAVTATGYDKLNRLDGMGVTVHKGVVVATAAKALWGSTGLVGSGGVSLTQAGNTLYGDALSADPNLINGKLTGHVHGHLKSGTTFKTALLLKKGETITAPGKVSAVMPATGPYGKLTVSADKMTAAQDGRHCLLTGHVQVRAADGSLIQSPSAQYDGVAGTLIATGGVYFKDARLGLEQHGEVLTVNLNNRTATLTNGHGQGDQRVFGGKKLLE